MALHWLFPTPVLQVDLEPDAATAAAMQQQLEQFDAQVYQHPEFSDRNNLTGDLLGHAGLDQLHRMDAFQWLNGQLEAALDDPYLAVPRPQHAQTVVVDYSSPNLAKEVRLFWCRDMILNVPFFRLFPSPFACKGC